MKESFRQIFTEVSRSQAAQGRDMQVYNTASLPKYLEMVERLQEIPFQRVLEIGTSWFSLVLKKVRPDCSVTTWDLTSAWEDRAKEAGVDFHQVNILQAAPEVEEPFDVILYSEVMEHLQGNPRLALDNFFQALRPGGILLLTTPNLVRLHNRVKFLLGRTPLEPIGPSHNWGGHFREYTLAEVVELCRDQGFRVENAYHAMYWDRVPFLLTSGIRGYDAHGNFFYHPRFRGWRKLYGFPFCWVCEKIAQAFPSLRNGMVVVARRP